MQTWRTVSSPISLCWSHSKEVLFFKELEICGVHDVQMGQEGKQAQLAAQSAMSSPEDKLIVVEEHFWPLDMW